MGFFSDIAQGVRRDLAQQSAQPVWTTAMPAAPEPEPVPAETPVPEPAPPVPEASAGAPETPPADAADVPAPEPAGAEPAPEPVPETVSKSVSETPPEQPEKRPEQPAIDLTPGADAADETAKRKAHEAAEAKRKAEFDARQAEKKAKRQAELDRIAAMDDAELLTAVTGRVAADTERLTRRNMKEAVAEHVQSKFRTDIAFARRAMAPEKSMANCFRYILRKAREYAEQEMKDNGEERTGVYGLDVPDGVVYQWAEDYFDDPDATEDRKNEEKFVPRPYTPARKPAKAKTAKAKAGKPEPAAEKPKPAAPVMEQMSLL